MITQRKPYNTYTREFKLEAVRLMDESGRPPAEIAMELGIRHNQLYKWKEQLMHKGEAAFPNQRGRPKKEAQSELVTLQQENKRLTLTGIHNCAAKVLLLLLHHEIYVIEVNEKWREVFFSGLF